ncbi:MAG: hypothetical protein LBH56_04230 [Coriobacteriales bacterium]|jgi:hypothetical protein|nr:hypothetical protein [Coriobacteriales bacterium]
MSQEREPHNGFEKSAVFYLEAAQAALESGQSRLAIHLFRAAYEIETTYSPLVSGSVLEGMRKAWDLAFAMGDRSIAESIFGDLAPHNSPEENEKATMRLQALAFDQLEDMGITEDDLESIAGIISREMISSDNEKLVGSLKSVLEQIGVSFDEDEDIRAFSASATNEAGEAGEGLASPPETALAKDSSLQAGLVRIGKELRESVERSREENQQRRLDYQALYGYSRALQRMRSFGFLSAGDEGYRSFIERSAAMHGVPRLSLDGTFLFSGPTREDVALFAHATAGEIGFPVLHVSVDLDKQGNGTIKLAGPFRRGFFGSPPDLMDMVTPCTVLIENIDYLQEMFDNEQQAIKRSGGRFRGVGGQPGRSMQLEITAYLQALRRKPGIIIMATSQQGSAIRTPLRNLLGAVHEIEVAAPCEEERLDVLINFASKHPSFAELDIDRIAYLSEGLSRSDLMSAAHTAVESAYRESLRTGRYNRVTMGDVLIQLAPFINRDSPFYQQVEDEAVAQLAHELEKDMPQ